MDSVVLITKRYKEKTMAKESQNLDKLNSDDEKLISKNDNEIIPWSISVSSERSRLGFSIFIITIDM